VNESMSDIIAINVLIEPDAKVHQIAVEANRRLGATTDPGFAFDDTHVPHISVLHRYVRTRDLRAIYAAVDRLVTSLHPERSTLTATGYEASTTDEKTIVSISVQQSPEIDRFQAALVDAIAPYSLERGDERAFFRTADSMHIDPSTIDYVASFVPTKIGANYSPHITLGRGDQATARQMQNEAFAPIPVQPVAIAVYQIGNMGTARKKLHECPTR
jgi:2'-5' RNA ligase superfamily